MANSSILVAFERMWQHVVTALSKKSDISHNHNDVYYTETEIDGKINDINTSISGKANSSHTHTIANITNLQTTLDGKAASSHTHNYAGSSSAGGAATSANKVNSSLTVKLNGGTTEGTNMFTFNGSAAKAVNVTPSAIGAAASSHTHDDRYYTEAEIDEKVSTLNTAINGKANSSHTHTIANVTNLQTTLDGKYSTSGGNISGHVYLTGANSSSSIGNTSQIVFGTASSNHVAISSNENTIVINPDTSSTTNQIVLYLDKASEFPSGISANVTGNLSGTATSANKINTDAGSATQPVYFSGGVPVKTTYTLGSSVPSGAKFTDTNTTYTFATGDSNGQIKVTPSGGTAQNVSVKGLGTAAYTASTAYATAAQGTLASNAMPKSGGTFTGGVIVPPTGASSWSVKNISVHTAGSEDLTGVDTQRIVMLRK